MRRSCLPILASIILLSSCNGSGTSGTRTPFVAGKWSATIVTSSPAQISTLDMNLTLTGDTISSDPKNTADNMTCGGDVNHVDSTTGTVKGNQFSLVFTVNSETINITGTISAFGEGVNGTFTSSGGACLNGDSGTFAAGLIPPVTGLYTGTMTSLTNAVFGVTAMLSEDASFNVSASMMVTNNTCFSAVATEPSNLGMSIGDLTVFTVTDGTNSVDFLGRIGQVNNSPTSFSANWLVTMGCTGQQGVANLSTPFVAAMRAPDANSTTSAEPKIPPFMVERLKNLLAARHEQ